MVLQTNITVKLNNVRLGRFFGECRRKKNLEKFSQNALNT